MDTLVMLALTLFALVVMTLLMPTLGRALYNMVAGKNAELGGYVHDTSMSQWIPPTAAYGDTAAWAMADSAVSGIPALACDATDETANLYIPIPIPSNSVSSKGAYLKSIEIYYEILTAACDSVTATIEKVTYAADGTVAALDSTTAFTQSPTAANSKTADQHKLVLTVTTPFYLDNGDAYYAKLALDKAGTSTVEFIGAVANYTLRL